MKVNVLKRLSTEAKIVDEYSRNGFFSCDIEFPTVGSGMKFIGRPGYYSIRHGKVINEITFDVYSNGSTYYQKASNPVYEKRYEKDLDEQTKKEILEGFNKDRKELQSVAEQINKIYEEAGKKAEAVLKKAGYSLIKG